VRSILFWPGNGGALPGLRADIHASSIAMPMEHSSLRHVCPRQGVMDNRRYNVSLTTFHLSTHGLSKSTLLVFASQFSYSRTHTHTLHELPCIPMTWMAHAYRAASLSSLLKLCILRLREWALLAPHSHLFCMLSRLPLLLL